MIEEERKKLEFIKQKISEGSYQILSPQQWDQFSYDLANCGAKILKELENAREKIRELRVARLTIHRTPRHIYAQVIDGDNDKVLAAASTVQADVKAKLKYSGNKDAAVTVGQLIAEKAKAAGVSKVAFDRSGFKYHGRVKALADAAREAGLEF